ncbi:hypothetical protein GCM10009544_04480 [Streptomyces stramineus]|uniref:Uncharacterized protein n=1 Tax=Streptomyces stramineus TaxID=173861 RepID=A0ABN0ZEL2_9ACTN
MVPRAEPEQFGARSRWGRRVPRGGYAGGQQVAERGQVRYVRYAQGLRAGGGRVEGALQRADVQRAVEPPGAGEHVGPVARYRLRRRAARCPVIGHRGGFGHVGLPSLLPRAGA